MVIGFTATGDSTTTDFPGSWYVAGKTAGGVTTFGTPQLLANGFGDYHLVAGGRNRWGDFSAISVDPNNSNAFWIAEEKSIDGSDLGFPTVWGTQITEVLFTGGPPAVPEPASVMLLATGALLMMGYGWWRRNPRSSETAA